MACQLGLTPAALDEIHQDIEQQLTNLLAPIRASLARLAHQDRNARDDKAELATSAASTEII
jgi:hypothetical protein